MGTWISLPFGGANAGFHVAALVAHMDGHGLKYIIQGQTACALSAHPKPHSLDVWLRRNFASNRDTKQAVNEVIAHLVATGLFEEGKFPCPGGGGRCKGIRLVK